MDWLSIREFLIDSLKCILFLAVILFIAIYIVGFQQIVGSSMDPTFKNNDVIIIDKFSYRFSSVKRGDIISFYYADSKFLVKRVIGLPGDSIQYKDNKLYINGELEEEYYLHNTTTEDFIFENIPEDMYFVLGDNRSDSLDSRDEKVGLIMKNDIIGKAIFRVWPFKKIGPIKRY